MSAEPVLVVGAGPVGLTAAHRLARHGANVRIVDAGAGPSTTSKALVIWRRTLTVLDSTIPFHRFVEAGYEARRARFFSKGELIGAISLEDAGRPVPAGVFIPQSDTERILTKALEEQGIRVAWRTKLLSFEQDADGVTCVLEEPEGQRQTRCSWLIGCDGAHSTARHQLRIPFPGEAVDRRWILADVRVDAEVNPHEARLEVGYGRVVAVFPAGPSRVRVIADEGPTEGESERLDPTDDELQTLLDARTSTGWRIAETCWRADFRINERQVERYVHGRVLLAGDAAHVHSPAGGQGMNTGIQDAANLAWKVALVEVGGADRSLLESYQEERHPVGRAVLRDSGRMLRLAQLSGPVGKHLRDLALHIGLRLPAVQERASAMLTEDTIHYRGSSLCGGGVPDAVVQPGDSFPDVVVGTTGGPRSAIELLRGVEAVCVVFGQVDTSTLPDRFGSGSAGPPLAVRRVGDGTDIPKVSALAAAFGLGRTGLVLVRPDAVVAAVARAPSDLASSLSLEPTSA